MARGNDPNSAGSQFFIVHQDSNFLDAEYTAFGRLIPIALNPTLQGSFQTLDMIANLETDNRDAPLDVTKATIVEASIAKDFSISDFGGPDRNESIIKQLRVAGGLTENYLNYLHNISFDLPLRWEVQDGSEDYLMLVLQPTADEHNVQVQIEKSNFVPQVIILSEEITPIDLEAGVSTAFFLIKGADEPKVSANYIFENDDGVKAHLVVGTQELPIPGTTETEQFKIIQIHFMNSELSYSIIYVNVTEWFRYEINAFVQTVDNFEVMFDGKMQPINFSESPVFRQIIVDAKAKPEPESLPPVRVGGCLIATASYGSELAPQVQQLRELRDNTVLQTESGAAFMTGFNQFYYSFSPMIADYERENPAFKEVVKLVITPLLTSLTLLQYADIDSEYEMLGYGIAVILLNIGMYFIAPAVLITKIRSFYKLQ
jgi:peptidyl-prolyl cis-trans isomerase B (cyclophilin B)